MGPVGRWLRHIRQKLGAIFSLQPQLMCIYLVQKSQLTSIGTHISESKCGILHLTTGLLRLLSILHCSLLCIPLEHICVPDISVVFGEMIGEGTNT